VWWSIPAAGIIFYKWAVVTAAEVSIFPVHWSQAQIIEQAWLALASGRIGGLVVALVFAASWALVLAPWKDPGLRVIAVVLATVVPFFLSIAAHPCGLPLGPLLAAHIIATGADGESLQDFGMMSGASLWVWFMGIMFIAAMRDAPRPTPGMCQACNYNLAGLPANSVCPECGAAPSPAPAKE
jgi:hypothetical protein